MLYIKRLCFFFIYCTSSKTLFFRSYKLAEHINITHPIFSNETNGNVHPVIKINQNIWTETICIFASGHLVDLSVHLCMWWCCCFLLIFDVLMFFFNKVSALEFYFIPTEQNKPRGILFISHPNRLVCLKYFNWATGNTSQQSFYKDVYIFLQISELYLWECELYCLYKERRWCLIIQIICLKVH